MRRLVPLALLVPFLLAPSGFAQCEPTVSEAYVVDPLFSGGGYYEITAENSCSDTVHVVCVGNSGSDVVFRDAATAPNWRAGRWFPEEWDAGDIIFSNIWYIAPKTETVPFLDAFGIDLQVLVYYVRSQAGPSEGIAPGGTVTGLRHLGDTGAPSGPVTEILGSAQAGSGFVIFGADGEVVAQGVTSGPVPVEDSTWGRLKTLYRR